VIVHLGSFELYVYFLDYAFLGTLIVFRALMSP